jgi:GNAT superfamily N-acetyltransferase
MQWRRGAFAIDTDRDRLDLEAITGWLQASYWARTRSAAAVRRSWERSKPVFGLYAGERQIGCARVVTDFVAVAYLADVFLVPEHRGAGLGRWLVETIVSHPELATVGWLLHTRDAHHLYRQVGFQDVGPKIMERPRPS